MSRVASRMTELVLDAHDPERLATFWCDVLGWVVTARRGYEIEIGPPEGDDDGGPTMVIDRSSDIKTQKLRLHIDLRPTDRDHQAELDRLLAAGAVPADIGQGDDVRWAVLADPEGNEFCLLHPIEELPE
jgi:predicted enzyme related to lactoylglutathione lyase